MPEGPKVGQPIKLGRFQKRFIRAVYRKGIRRAILSIAKKNGKTALIAAILLAHIIGPEAVQNSQIVSAAQSRDQAALVFKLACKMLDLNEDLDGLYRYVESGKRIYGLLMNVEFRALAAEAKSTQGVSPVLIIFDETGQVEGPTDAFFDALDTSQGAYDEPLQIIISTQAATDNALLSRLIDDADNDEETVCHVYAAKENANVLDRKAWKASNPALGDFRSLPDLERLAKQAHRSPSGENSFRNLNLNQRVQKHSPAVAVNVWNANSGNPDYEVFYRQPVYAGLDLSETTDLTALVLVAREDGVIHVWPHFWTPGKTVQDRSQKDRVPYDLWVKQDYLNATSGNTVLYPEVAADMADILSGMNLELLNFDRKFMKMLTPHLSAEGLDIPLNEFGQGFISMTPAWAATEAALLDENMRHGGHPVLKSCALNAVLKKDPAGNKKLDKAKSNGRIDGMVALLMAVAALETASGAAPVASPWDDEGFSLSGLVAT
ncbi:MAG: terminase TerL endonuclease subunit [Pseudomonadota bacterium]